MKPQDFVRDSFVERHIGPSDSETQSMLSVLGCASLEQLVGETVPAKIRLKHELKLGEPRGESDVLELMKSLAARNQVFRSYIGAGYSDTLTPAVILRNILENPGWYTQYTPYQAEISQGRLEALLNFQTMVSDLTGLPISNASLLDEATAAAEAMAMSFGIRNRDASRAFFIAESCHPQSIAVVKTRAEAIGVKVVVGNPEGFRFDPPIFGMLLQYPDTNGVISDYTRLIEKAHGQGALVTIAADLLALTLLKSPGELGADIAVGSAQRFGVPMGFGGPHAAFLSARDEFKRLIPGRLVGLSKDTQGNPAVRLALQTREQHIRRDKATSNICTAQVLLAIMASMYAVYHGPAGLRRIAERVHLLAELFALGMRKLGHAADEAFFDTVRVTLKGVSENEVQRAASAYKMNLRPMGDGSICVALDETTRLEDLDGLFTVFNGGNAPGFTAEVLSSELKKSAYGALERKSPYLTHPVFNSYHSETEMLRYMHRLQSKDLSLAHSMIPLGSCTMKLNATAEMIPITWPEFARLHPFAPAEQARGYQALIEELERWLAEITGFKAISLQPNAGSQGEFAGLLVIKKYHQSRGDGHRDVCLIPQSAHGTNPASAALAGLKVVVVRCDENGNVDVSDLRAKAEHHARELAALMITYPSTHGVFEEAIHEICDIVHRNGGQVYMDGANMNAQVGICRPGDFGADVCHLNLHKTFCIPHGGGGPGMGPIGVREHLAPFLPGHPLVRTGGESAIGPISAAPFGSASILPISYAYIAMMGAQGLKRATEIAILNANYIAHQLAPHYPILYKGRNGRVAHECIIDLRPLKSRSGVEVEDVAKRLMDYGFHAPTISFPVAGTMMIEPTESESKAELDRFCDAMIRIRHEIAAIEQGKSDRSNNVLKNAPHTAEQIASDKWDRPYSRELAAYPASWVRERKFWPSVSRIDAVYGDRHLVCSCPPIESYS